MQPLIGRYQRLFFVLSSPQVSHLNGTTNCSANRQDGVIKGQQKQAKMTNESSGLTRARRPRIPQCRAERKGPESLVLSMRFNQPRSLRFLKKTDAQQPATSSRPARSPSQAGGSSRQRAARTQVSALNNDITSQSDSPYSVPFYSFHERENDDLKSKPYGGILSEADADTTKTFPLASDRAKFEAARQKAEEDWRRQMQEAEREGRISAVAEEKLSGPPSKIKCINFGGWEIGTWYAAPYPEEYSRNRVLHICEFCLKYMNSAFVAWRHRLKCPAKHPPGDEIYRDASISIFEVDGRNNPVYCQNLCLLAKLFLGSKTLYYDVEPFLFYVMTECDELGCHFVGYFSKEKRLNSPNNVSCILTLPTHQRKGYGNLLIDFSYLLTRVERKAGSPEKPLSDLGLVSYRNYWRLVLSYELRNRRTPLSISDISERTGMTADDIVSGLEGLRALVRDPVTKTYAFRIDYKFLEEYIENWEKKGYTKLNPDALVWTPYIMSRGGQTHLDSAPLHAVAPRGEDGGLQEDQENNEINGGGSGSVFGDASSSGNIINGLPGPTAAHDGKLAPAASIEEDEVGPTSIPPSIENNEALQNMTLNDGTSRVGQSQPPNLFVPSPERAVPPWRFEIYPPDDSLLNNGALNGAKGSARARIRGGRNRWTNRPRGARGRNR